MALRDFFRRIFRRSPAQRQRPAPYRRPVDDHRPADPVAVLPTTAETPAEPSAPVQPADDQPADAQGPVQQAAAEPAPGEGAADQAPTDAPAPPDPLTDPWELMVPAPDPQPVAAPQPETAQTDTAQTDTAEPDTAQPDTPDAELDAPVRPPRYVRPRSARPRRVEPAPLDADQASSLLLQLATERLPSEVARELLDLARPTLGLTAAEAQGDVTLTSRLGGLPVLPPRTPWPEHEGRPLHFVGQVDLAETSVLDVDLTLPRFGLLGFFYLPEDDLWGYDPDDRTGWRVLLTDSSSGQPREAPSDVEVYRTRRLVPRATWTLPDGSASVLAPLRQRGGEAVDEVLAAFGQASGRTRHQLLGWPAEGQDAMARAATVAAGGRFAGVGVDPSADPSGWQLLLQVDSDDEAGMVWGDDCRLCFWLPTQSLITGRLSDAWMLMRCG